ncbi:MAG: TM2 domain-containing protein [Clostridia bacterium]|nr:TM2 domain-containing protein [Clostridia bacterium]
MKNKYVAGILAILLGDLGIHKFYLGKIGSGILYLLFCWTGIPAIIGLIEGIIYLCTDDETFQVKYCGMPPSGDVNKNAVEGGNTENQHTDESHMDDLHVDNNDINMI